MELGSLQHTIDNKYYSAEIDIRLQSTSSAALPERLEYEGVIVLAPSKEEVKLVHLSHLHSISPCLFDASPDSNFCFSSTIVAMIPRAPEQFASESIAALTSGKDERLRLLVHLFEVGGGIVRHFCLPGGLCCSITLSRSLIHSLPFA